MAGTLQESLLAPEIRPQVIADCEALIKQEVKDMSGVSGAAIKVAYKTVHLFSADHVRYIIDTLLPRMSDELEPYWKEFQSSGESGFGAYLAARSGEVSEVLLSITDERGRNSERPVITKAYGAVRDKAAKHVVAALPRVGALIQKYAG